MFRVVQTRTIPVFFLAILLIGATPSVAFEFHSSLDTELANGNVTGPGTAGYSVDENLSYRADFHLIGNKEIDNSDQLLALGLGLGSDLGMGSRTIALSGLKWEMATDNYGLKAGDVMESFSQYSLSSSLKGLSYTQSFHDLEVTLTGGYAYPRWENIYAAKDVPATQRQVIGARVGSGKASRSETAYGINVVSSTDLGGLNPSDKLYSNVVLAGDTEFRPIPGLTVRALGALSGTTEKASNNVTNGNAIKLEASSAAKQGRAIFEYERATPGFMTTMGSSIADKQRVKLRVTSNHTKTFSSTVGYLFTSDNVEKQKTKTTTSHKPEFSLSFKRPFNRRYATFNTALKLDYRKSGADSDNGRTLSLDYRDRFGLIDTSFAIANDSAGAIISANQETTFRVELGTRADLGAAILRPTLERSVVVDANKSTNYWQQTTDTAIDLRMDFLDSNINSNLRFGQQSSADPVLSPKRTYTDLSIYCRPAFLSKLNDGRVYFRATHSNYGFVDASNDRAETSARAGVNLSW